MTAYSGCISFDDPWRGEPIPPKLRRVLEATLRCDLSDVRLQMDSNLEALGALACVQGGNIRLSTAAPGLDTPAGIAVLGHELAHVLQQRAGRVSGDGAVVEDAALEAEADRVGLHCAARLFPSRVADPGMPAMARALGDTPGGDAAPIQFLISSRQSFEAFVNMAWNYFNLPMVDELSGPHNLNDLYAYAAEFNPLDVAPKTALTGTALYAAMQTFIQATVPNRIEMQFRPDNWPDLTDDVDALAQYYADKAGGLAPPRDQIAETLTRTYLHVYPQAPADGNWRLGLNVLPQDMAAAMAALTPLLNGYANIDHMKFLAPGNCSKADSVIVYLDRDADGYQALKTAVLDAAAGLTLQPRVGAMWEEIAAGIGEASEPPMGGASFSTYRCMVAFLAHDEYRKSTADPTFNGFKAYLGLVMQVFGMDSQLPFLQGPLPVNYRYLQNWWDALEVIRVTWGRWRAPR